MALLRADVGLDWTPIDNGPHICRHTAATWLMQGRVDIYEAAGYLGKTPETLWSTYGHHHPDFQRGAANATGKRRRSAPPVEISFTKKP